MIRIQRALLSVYDKRGIVEFARTLAELGIEIVSTGATAGALRDAGLAVVSVEEITRWPEMFGGRLKTLTPQIHGGLLMRRGHPTDRAQAEQHGIRPIDLLCVNLYPFAESVARPGARYDDCIEMIDIGGPAMVRAAAKNHRHVVVVSDVGQYPWVAALLRESGGAIAEDVAIHLAREAFATTAAYDAAIFRYLDAAQGAARPDGVPAGEGSLPSHWAVGGRREEMLRYGENPSQQAACYVSGSGFWSAIQQHQGKALSYNNLADLWAAWRCVGEFADSACVIIKHATPSGVALGEGPAEAFARARDADPLSAFGGVVIFNRPGDAAVAAALSGMFLEVVAAPVWAEQALRLLGKKSNLRVLTIPAARSGAAERAAMQFKSLGEAILVQTPLPLDWDPERWQCVAGGQADAALRAELSFAWRVVRHVRSNAIALTREAQTLGLGGGQTSRIDALEIALHKAARCGHGTAGAVLASDAFFPFRDVVDRAAAAGVSAIVQPGGSRRDKESIDACNQHGISMFFTGDRVFAH